MTLAVAVVDEVRARMTARGMSARALARAAGMPASLLHRAMAGERPLSLDELDAVSAALGVQPDYLVRMARQRLTRPGEGSELNGEPRQV